MQTSKNDARRHFRAGVCRSFRAGLRGINSPAARLDYSCGKLAEVPDARGTCERHSKGESMHATVARSIVRITGGGGCLGQLREAFRRPAGRTWALRGGLATFVWMTSLGPRNELAGDSGEQKGTEFGVILVFYQLRWLEGPAWPDCPAGQKGIGISRSGSKLNLLAACRLFCSLIAARSSGFGQPWHWPFPGCPQV